MNNDSTENKTIENKQSKSKSTIVAVVGIIAFILAFVVMKYITQEGISAFRGGISKNQTEQKVINYPSQVDTSVPETNLEGSVNGTVQSIDGTLISSNFTYFGTYRAIEYLIYKKDGNAYIKGKNILVGQNMYQIAVAYEPSNSSNVQFDRFANSFQLQ